MLSVIEKVLLLQDLDLFRFAYSEHLAHLASICRETEVGKEIILFREGEESKRLHLLISGEVALEQEGTVIGSVTQGGLDTWSFFSENVHSYTAKALTECRLLTVTFEEMADLLTAEPEFCWATLKYLARLGQKQLTTYQKDTEVPKSQ